MLWTFAIEVLCIIIIIKYKVHKLHQRRELPQATQVFVVVFV